ncbi:hypothetical protein BVY04_03340 [bacterium M21]|nr:hypothetical protein BVY04_03340 [bacterium M21]
MGNYRYLPSTFLADTHVHWDNSLLYLIGGIAAACIVLVIISLRLRKSWITARNALEFRENPYRQLIENSPDIVMRFDNKCRFTYASPNVNRVMDVPLESFIGKTHRELKIPEETCVYFEESIRSVLESGKALEQEFEFDGAKGKRYFNRRLIPEFNADDQVETVLSIARDITEEKGSREQYRMLFDQMLDGFALHEIICDTEGEPVDYRFLAMNPAFEALTGLVADDLVGRTVLEAMPGTEMEWIQNYGDVARTGTPLQFCNYSQELNKHFEVLVYRPAPGQFACVFQDVTDQVLATKELEKQKKRERLLNTILQTGLEERSLESKLKQILNVVLEIPWLHLTGEGCIFLLNADQSGVDVRVTHNIGDDFADCDEFSLQNCFCCHALLHRSVTFIENVTDDYQYCVKRPKFGYYSIPIHAGNTGLGSMVLYTKANFIREEMEEEFLSSIAQTLAGIIKKSMADTVLLTGATHFRSLFESSNDAIFIHNMDGDILRANERATGLLGYTLDEFSGRHLSSLHPDSERDRVKDAFHTCQKLGWVRFESTLRTKDGQDVYVEISSSIVDHENGIVQGIVRDITARRAAEVALQDNEKRYRSLMYASRAMALSLSLEGVIIRFDELACQITGYTKDEAKGKTLSQLMIMEESRERFDNELELAQTGEQRNNIECRIQIKGAFQRDIMFNLVPHIDSSGNQLGVFVAGRDITELHIANKKRKISEARVKQVIENAPVILFSYSEQGKVLYVSENLFSLTGIRSEELLAGKADWTEIIHPDDQEQLKELWQQSIEHGSGLECEYRIINRVIQQSRWMDTRITATKHAKGIIFTGVTVDISVRKQVENENAKLEETLRQAEKLQAIGQLAGGIAHDFNNMLGAISGASELMKVKNTVDPNGTIYLEMIMETIQRATNLNQQLMSFARKGPTCEEDLDLHILVRHVIEMLHHTVDKKITIERKFNARRPLFRGDQGQLQNCLLNLGVNARDAMPNGGTLTFETYLTTKTKECLTKSPDAQPGEYLCLRISDTGNGIKPEIIGHIFEPFFTTKREGKGTGLGLASVYGTVKRHKGIIDVESTVGKGTTFHLCFPYREKAEPEQWQPPEYVKISEGSGTILLAEDEEILRETMTETLELLGYAVLPETNGEDAIACYRENRDNIELVILDMIMPRLNGVEALRIVKEIDARQKVLIISGFSEKEKYEEAIELGVDGMLQKPVNISELSMKLTELMGDAGGEK